MSKKKAPKSTLHGPAGGSFSQKKKVVLGNVKHSDDKRNISLVKLGSDDMYSDMDIIEGINNGSLLGSTVTILKAKRMNSSMIVKTPVEVSVRKLFALNINLLAVEGKFTTAKTQFIKKIFSTVNGFGRATTPSKFEGII
ncbi:hypothetical protein G9A89_016762 [Geosiphon pyriformis]|nr:hypothetical protein G9A89_016762 [Geosiphon pyriformis]